MKSPEAHLTFSTFSTMKTIIINPRGVRARPLSSENRQPNAIHAMGSSMFHGSKAHFFPRTAASADNASRRYAWRERRVTMALWSDAIS